MFVTQALKPALLCDHRLIVTFQGGSYCMVPAHFSKTAVAVA